MSPPPKDNSPRIQGVCVSLFCCSEEFFAGFRFEGDATYFTSACANLTAHEQDEVKRAFAEQLDKDRVCRRGRRRFCDISNMGIICGVTRTRRSVHGESDDMGTVGIQFEVKAHKIADRKVDCGRICPMLRISERYCERYCVKAYKRYLRAGVMHARALIQTMYAHGHHKLAFHAASRNFRPTGEGHVTEINMLCEPGMAAHGGMCGENTLHCDVIDKPQNYSL